MTDDYSTVRDKIVALLTSKGLEPISVNFREFPEELIVVIDVPEVHKALVMELVPQIDATLPVKGFSVVRGSSSPVEDNRTSVKTVADERVTRLIELLNERSRTSEQQPSLSYIRDAAENLRVALTRRHHVIFGRRGVGKTALLLEAKEKIEKAGGTVVWINVQSLRELGALKAFLNIVQRICEVPLVLHKYRSSPPQSVQLAHALTTKVADLLSQKTLNRRGCAPTIPDAQRLIGLICAETGADLFVFVDDLHYIDVRSQPVFLDLLHGITRDTAAWLKIAGIKNQCRIFTDDPPTGLQIGHDAALISLDVTLEEPNKALTFLTDVLRAYLNEAGIGNRSGVFTIAALERLVLASGGVPRDFLLLAARSIQIARQRTNSRTVGVQDVNEAAGDAGKQKRAELEDDAASAVGQAAVRLNALDEVRQFAIDEHHYSFFRVNFRDKEQHQEEYRFLQSLMDLRMLHLVKSSLSEAHGAGERSEVYMLDLSEFSGSRLKKHISVIELRENNLVLRKTGATADVIVADTGRRLIQLFRTGPLFDLQRLSRFVAGAKHERIPARTRA